MSYAIKSDGVWKEIVGSFSVPMMVNDKLDNVSHPANWPDLVSADDRVAAGVAEIVEPGPQPITARVVGTEVVDVAGVPTRQWVTEPLPLEELSAILLPRLDADAEATRLQYITPGAGQGMTYQYKVNEALAWTTDNSASTPFLTAEAAARGMSVADLVAEVQGNAAAWTVIGSRIEAARMGAKTAVRAAADTATMIAASEVDWQAVIA
jgi:hypothetical protein